MFNALTSLGGAGQTDPTTSNNANIALYTTFAAFGCLSGAAHNLLGPRLAAGLGAIPYGLYALAFWNAVANPTQFAQGLAVASGAVLGIGAAIMWTAQGTVMMSYPSEENKGKYIAIFWTIFNAGPVLGNILTTAINWDNPSTSVSTVTYLIFTTIMFGGAVIGFALAPSNKVKRDDGSPVVIEKERGVATEVQGLIATFTDRSMLCLVPACLASNFFYTVHFNALNGANFSIRTKSFNSIFYWAAQIFGAVILGKFLDDTRYTRAQRGTRILWILVILTIAAWTGFLVMLSGYYGEGYDRNNKRKDAWDLINSTSKWVGPFALYTIFGLLDAAFQSFAYWIMGALSNDRDTLARYAGFYKGIQSIGGAFSWAFDGPWEVQYIPQACTSFGLLMISFPFMYLILQKIDRSDSAKATDAKVVDCADSAIDGKL
jgi:hypothetical protein